MPYVFELEREFDQEPYIDGQGSRIIDFALGYDFDRFLIVLMSVMLVPDESGAFELCFGIRTRNAERSSEVSPPDYSVTTARRFVPEAANQDVLATVLAAIIVLVEAVQPETIVMETFHANLPPKAMKKYQRISEVLDKSSYAMTDQFRDELDGKDYWAFGRKD
jgi:hypothetical protein